MTIISSQTAFKAATVSPPRLVVELANVRARNRCDRFRWHLDRPLRRVAKRLRARRLTIRHREVLREAELLGVFDRPRSDSQHIRYEIDHIMAGLDQLREESRA